MSVPNRRAADDILLPIYLEDDDRAVPVADGEVFGFGFKAYLDKERTVELVENDRVARCCPVCSSPGWPACRSTTTCCSSPISAPAGRSRSSTEPANPTDRDALAVLGGGVRVGFVPAPIAGCLAPSGTRVGRGVVLKEWSTNGMRQDIWILGSMHVRLSIVIGD